MEIIKIETDIGTNEVQKSDLLKDLNSYLQQKGHNKLELNKKKIKDAKADLVTWLSLTFAGVAAIYPILQDIQAWIRPRKYSITITDGIITSTANDLTLEEFIEITKELEIERTKIEITK